MRSTVRLAASTASRSAPTFRARPSGLGRRRLKIGRGSCQLPHLSDRRLKGFLEAEGLAAQPHQAAAARSTAWPRAARRSPTPCAMPPMSSRRHDGHGRDAARDDLPAARPCLHFEFYTDLDYGYQGELIITREHHAKDPADAAARSIRALREGLTRSSAARPQGACRCRLRPFDTPKRRGHRHCGRNAVEAYRPAA